MDELITRLGWNLILCIPVGIFVWCLTRTPKIRTRPAICHGLWLLVLLKMVTPPFIPMPLVPDVWNISADRFSQSAAQPPATIEPQRHAIVADSTTQTALSPQRSPSPTSRAPVILAADQLNMNLGRVATIAVVLASLAVTMGIWLIAFRQLERLQRLLTGYQSQSDRANQLLGKLAPEFRLRTIPDLIIVDSPIAPFVWAGPRQPVVVLSQQLIQSLDDGQLEFVLAHELAHLKRCDHWSNLFGFFVTTLFWWHPVAWLARRELGLAAEACCDAMALQRCSGSHKSYAQTLLCVIDLMNGREFSRPALLLNFGGTSSLRKRIQMLTDSTVRTRISVGGWLLLLIVAASLSLLPVRAQESGQPPKPAPADGDRKITIATVKSGDVTLTQKYAAQQIHAHRHITIRTLADGFLEEAPIKEGRKVKEGDLLFSVAPELHQARLDAAKAELKVAQLAYASTKKLFENSSVPHATESEMQLSKANLSQAEAKAKQAEEALHYAQVKAPFDGLIGGFDARKDRFVKDGEVQTTLTDPSLMWVYFNVSKARSLEYRAHLKQNKDGLKIELLQPNGQKFSQVGRIGAIEADFKDETKTIPFRADFPNPDGELRHGQTGTVLISEVRKNVIAIPQKATFEDDGKHYVFVVGKDDVASRRLITIQTETEDQVVVGSGISTGDKIVVDGVKLVQDGKKVDHEKR
jgi:membrane fusion protein, multidrug efflux system